jgi:zinc transporter ZupT
MLQIPPENIWIALAVTLAAGLATAIGSLLVLFSRRPNPRLLAFGLAFAGGAMVFMLASLHPGHDAQVVAAFGLLGFFLIPLLPVNLESAAEATYPVPEDNSAAVVLSVGQVFGIVSVRDAGGARARVA